MDGRGFGKGFEDYRLGERWRTPGRTITEADLVAFCRLTGMVGPSFTNHEYRRKHGANPRPFVPAALAYTFIEGFCLREMAGASLAFLEASFDVKGPCFVGDTIHGEIEVTELRVTGPGDRGLMRTRNMVRTQDDRTVLVYSPLRLMKRRTDMAALTRSD
ncbi:MAG: acyl dehydratase [Alphaproteobacteria bacterium]